MYRDFPRDFSRHHLWSSWVLFFGCWFCFVKKTESLPISLRGPKSGVGVWTPWCFGYFLSLFSKAVSVLLREEKVPTWGLRLPKSSGLHLKHVMWALLARGFHQLPPARTSRRSARVGVSSEAGVWGGMFPPTAAVMLRAYFGNSCLPRTFQFPPRRGEERLFKASN